MSNAFKCDRCKEFFEKSTKQPEIDCLVVGHKSISQLIDHTTVWYDICPKCVEELTEWLKKPTQNLKLCNRERCKGCEQFGWIEDKAWGLGYYTCNLFNAKVMNQSSGDYKCKYSDMITPIDFKNAPFILNPIPDENEEEK